MSKDNMVKRKSIRFDSDPNWMAWLSLESRVEDFKNDIVGLVINESKEGCSIIFRDLPEIENDKTYYLQVGSLDPLKAKVVWRKEIDEGVIRVGFSYTS